MKNKKLYGYVVFDEKNKPIGYIQYDIGRNHYIKPESVAVTGWIYVHWDKKGAVEDLNKLKEFWLENKDLKNYKIKKVAVTEVK